MLENLKPESVFKYFEKIASIPHGSTDTKRISDYCVEFAKERGLEHYQDDANNVIIIKDATEGYENVEPVIIQGHLDMVCEKVAGSNHDFMNDGLDLKIDGDYIYAEGTTLGGDDGIAVAYALALLDADSIEHPRLEVVLTVDEEIGMLGAAVLDTTPLKGKIMLNIDSEEEGILTTSCAGGMTAECRFDMSYVENEGERVILTVKGLKGGHSGVEINKGRASANILLGRILEELRDYAFYSVEGLTGGQKDNVIARQSSVTIIVDAEDKKELINGIRKIEKDLKREYRATDADIYLDIEETGNTSTKVLSPKSISILMFMLMNVPNGIQAMSFEIEGLVETSLNLGILSLDDEVLKLGFSVRSSVKSSKMALSRKLQYLTEFFGGEYNVSGDYPEWEYKTDSKLRDLMIDVYKEQYNAEPQVEAIHAGLECGIISNKIEGLDIVSFGPNMKAIHTAEEKLSISSTERVWKYLLEVLRRMKTI